MPWEFPYAMMADEEVSCVFRSRLNMLSCLLHIGQDRQRGSLLLFRMCVTVCIEYR